MREADAIVLGSPVYIDNISGQMKVFFDRLADAIHYQILAGKYGCSVATTYESGGDDVVAYLNHVLNYLGILSVGGFSIATGGRDEAVEDAGPSARALGRKLAAAVSYGFSDPAQESVIEITPFSGRSLGRTDFAPMCTSDGCAWDGREGWGLV
jgi:multimeric flavodoxin WrbA